MIVIRIASIRIDILSVMVLWSLLFFILIIVIIVVIITMSNIEIRDKALDPEAWASWRRAPSRRPPAWRRCWSWMQPLNKQPIQEIHWKRWNMFNERGYSYLKLNVWKWPRSLPFSCSGPRWPCPSGSPGKDILLQNTNNGDSNDDADSYDINNNDKHHHNNTYDNDHHVYTNKNIPFTISVLLMIIIIIIRL